MSEECQVLRSTLTQVESECSNAKGEVQSLSGKVRNLESVLEEMHKAGENRREIERQHKVGLALQISRFKHYQETRLVSLANHGLHYSGYKYSTVQGSLMTRVVVFMQIKLAKYAKQYAKKSGQICSKICK